MQVTNVYSECPQGVDDALDIASAHRRQHVHDGSVAKGALLGAVGDDVPSGRCLASPPFHTRSRRTTSIADFAKHETVLKLKVHLSVPQKYPLTDRTSIPNFVGSAPTFLLGSTRV